MTCLSSNSDGVGISFNDSRCSPLETNLRFASGLRLLAFALAAVLIAGCSGPTSSEKIQEAEKLVRSGQIDAAKKIAASIPKEDAQWPAARYLLGMIDWQQESFETACGYFDEIALNGNSSSLAAAELTFEHYLKNCRLFRASEKLEYMFRFNAGTVEQRSTLAVIQVLGGRRNRADYHLLELLKGGQIELKDLVMLTLPGRQPPESDVFLKCLTRSTDDPFTSFAAASVELSVQNYSEAIRRLEVAVKAEPRFAEAHGLLGEVLLSVDRGRFEKWLSSLPVAVENHPSVWFAKGLYARTLGQNKVAIRCFWETVRKEPLHRRAVFQLGQCLNEVDATAAAAFSRRAAILGEADLLVERVLLDEGKKADDFARLIEILMECGRHWEAHAWIARVANDQSLGLIPQETQQSLSSIRGSSRPRFAESSDLTKKYDFSEYPLLDRKTEHQMVSETPTTPIIQFADQADQLGVKFQFYQSSDSSSDGVRIFESTGGGTGVTDLDGDGWADIVLTQGEAWPMGLETPVDSNQFHDGLFRKTNAGFNDVSEVAGIAPEGGYGQGCSSGDVNNDGFQDLYVANIGKNRLLINNGDGTFSDQTDSSQISGEVWTTSCLILDLNGDGHPDLYDVNYLSGDAVHKVECSENECSVRNFVGEEDQVQLSNGNGTFRRISDATPKENSKGLGIVTLYPRPEALPNLFIANDQVPNYFLRPGSDGKYLDEANVRGVAVNCDGRPTACMGVAVGDINNDRTADLFVTNFEGEANCLYLQDDQGYFFDAIRGTGIMAAGIPYVGWGTQFFDADNNQVLDLVVANGHVADFGKPGKSYYMPMQFFRGRGRVNFDEIENANSAELFTRKILGRSLAIVDWNRDGRQDFVVSSVGSPVIVATNQSGSVGHYVSLALHARHTSRDAVGACVELKIADGTVWRQLNAGDGYQATNERILHFGLDGTSTVESVSVTWPSGSKDVFSLAEGINRRYVIVEGHGLYFCD